MSPITFTRAFVSSICAALLSPLALAQCVDPDLPTWENYLAPQEELAEIAPSDGGSSVEAFSVPSTTMSVAAATDPEIVSLAASLGNDPLKIFNYVRNRISYVPYYGLKKGAVVTLVEGSGNDFDQCALLKALLNAAGQTNVSYVSRTQGIPLTGNGGNNTCEWVNVAAEPYPGQTYLQVFGNPEPSAYTAAGLSDAEAKLIQFTASTFSTGGIPSIQASPGFHGIVFSRVWIRLTTSTGTVDLDPSFKRYKKSAPIDIAALAGYNRSSLITAATSGSSTGPGWVQKLNTGGLADYLKTAASTLVTALDASYPTATVADITGGRTIIQQDAATLSDCFPLGTSMLYNSETVWSGDIPDAYLVKIEYKTTAGSANMDYVIPTAQLGDQRVTLTFSGNNVNLMVEDQATPVATAVTTATTIVVTSIITHPGPVGSSSKDSTYKKADGYAYALMHSFDPSGKSLQRRYQKLNAYTDGGLDDSSPSVRAELLNIMGVTWLYQSGLVGRIICNHENATEMIHHRLGRMGQEAGFYIDIGQSLSSTLTFDGSAASANNAIYGPSVILSAMEHGVIEQLQPGYSAVSTVAVVRAANDANLKLYLADINNWNAGAAANKVVTHLTGYSTATKASITTQINLGRKVFLPSKGNIQIGQWTGPAYAFRGTQTLQPTVAGYGLPEAGMIIGGYGGGYSTSYGDVSSPDISDNVQFDPVYSYVPPSASFDSFTVPSEIAPPLFAGDPVDMKTGAFTYGSTDLQTGVDPAPRGLRIGRSYTSNARQQNLQNLGNGWSHDLFIRAVPRTAAEEGLGLGSPRQAAFLLTAMIVIDDLYREDGSPSEWGTAMLTADWYMDHLTQNAVSISIGNQVIQFTKNPAGGFDPPTGSTMSLVPVGTGSTASYALTQRLGNTITFAYNTSLKVHRVSAISDPDGKSMTFTYDTTTGNTKGTLKKVTDAYGRHYDFSYSTTTPALITKITDSSDGRYVIYGYDSSNNLVSFTDAGTTALPGKTEYYDYALAGDPSGQAGLHEIRRVRNPLNQTVIESDYDSLGRVNVQRLQGDSAKATTLLYADRATISTVSTGVGNPPAVTQYFYDDRGRSAAVLNPDGFSTSWIYDSQDRVTSKTSGANETTGYHYDTNGNLTQIDLPRGGGSTTIQYDSLNRKTVVTDPDLRQTTAIYSPGNLLNRPDQVTDALGTTNYTYEPSAATAPGKLWKITTPEGLVTEMHYDANGAPDWTKAPGGFQTFFTYSTRGDLVSTTDPNGSNVTQCTYNNRRQRTWVTVGYGSAAPSVTDVSYDDAGNVASIVSPEDNDGQRYKVRSTYSPTKKPLFTYGTDEDGEGANDPSTQVVYDSRDLQKQVYDPLSRLTTFTATPGGQLQQASQSLGRTSSQVVDGNGRPTSITMPGSASNRITTLAYSITGTGDHAPGYPKTVTTTPDGLSVTDEFDHSGHFRYHVNRLGHVWEFRYDDTGRCKEILTPLDSAAGRSSVTEYYPRGAVKKVTSASGHVTTLAYDPASGRLATTVDGVGTVTNTVYDNNGNLKTSTEARGGPLKTTQRTYDNQNRLLTRTDENNQAIGYSYYPSGKLKALIYPGGTETGTGHVEYTWWKSGQLKQVTDKLDSTTSPRITSYVWSIDGKLTKVTRPNGTVREIKYDAAGRPEVIEDYAPGNKPIVVHKQGYYPSDEISWKYELPGKRTSGLSPPDVATMTYDDDNRLATWNGQTVVQDADGNMTSGPSPAGTSVVSYTYDARNRPTAAMGLSYSYDSSGHRLGISGPSETTTFVIDGSSSLSKPLVRTKNGVTTRYVWGLGLLYEVDGSGTSATTLTYHYDSTGNTLALTDGTGKLVERISYTPVGNIERRTSITGTPHDTPFLYSGFYGNQTDSNGLIYMRARYYHPLIGRFLNADPARQGWNWHGYAAGNPMGFVDPTGLGVDNAIHAVQDTLDFIGLSPAPGATTDVFESFGVSPEAKQYIETGLNLAMLAVPVAGELAEVALATEAAGAVEEMEILSATSRIEEAAEIGPMRGFQGTASNPWGATAPEELPELEISAKRYPELSENILNAQKAGHPDILTHGGDIAANRAAALQGIPNIKPYSRDEYPFASSQEGGAGSWVGHVPVSQQNAQGALMKNFFSKYNIQPGDRYRVIVTP